MPLGYQNTLALLISFVVHLCIAAILATLEYSAGKEASSLQITLSQTPTLSTFAKDTTAFKPTETVIPQPTEPETAAEFQTESIPQPVDSNKEEPPFPTKEMFPATKMRPSIETTTRKSTISPTHVPDLGILFGANRREETAKDARQGPQVDQAPPSLGHPSLLSPFQPYLLNHISQKKYHDKQYSFSTLQQERLVVLEITLHPNGTLINTKVAQSSGDNALDQAATRATIAASPFKQPPAADRRFDYTYIVSIQYLPE